MISITISFFSFRNNAVKMNYKDTEGHYNDSNLQYLNSKRTRPRRSKLTKRRSFNRRICVLRPQGSAMHLGYANIRKPTSFRQKRYAPYNRSRLRSKPIRSYKYDQEATESEEDSENLITKTSSNENKSRKSKDLIDKEQHSVSANPILSISQKAIPSEDAETSSTAKYDANKSLFRSHNIFTRQRHSQHSNYLSSLSGTVSLAPLLRRLDPAEIEKYTKPSQNSLTSSNELQVRITSESANPEFSEKTNEATNFTKNMGMVELNTDLDWEKENYGLPKGWIREVVQRKNGISAGKVDVYIRTRDGKKIRSRRELESFCWTNGIFGVDYDKVFRPSVSQKSASLKVSKEGNRASKDDEDYQKGVITLDSCPSLPTLEKSRYEYQKLLPSDDISHVDTCYSNKKGSSLLGVQKCNKSHNKVRSSVPNVKRLQENSAKKKDSSKTYKNIVNKKIKIKIVPLKESEINHYCNRVPNTVSPDVSSKENDGFKNNERGPPINLDLWKSLLTHRSQQNNTKIPSEKPAPVRKKNQGRKNTQLKHVVPKSNLADSTISIAVDAENTLNTLLQDRKTSDDTDIKPDVSTFCEVVIKEEKGLQEEELKKIQDDMAEFTALQPDSVSAEQDKANDNDTSSLQISDVRSIATAENDHDYGKTTIENAREKLFNSLQTFALKGQEKVQKAGSFPETSNDITNTKLPGPSRFVVIQQRVPSILRPKSAIRSGLPVKSTLELCPVGTKVILPNTPLSIQTINRINQSNHQSFNQYNDKMVQKIKSGHIQSGSDNNKIANNIKNSVSSCQDPASRIQPNKQGNTFNILSKINKNSTVVLLPRGTQIGPNNPIKIINPVARSNIKTTNGASSSNITPPSQQQRSMTLLDPSVLSQNNPGPQTSDASVKSPSQSLSSKKSEMNQGRILQLARVGTQIFNGTVKAKPIGTHLTTGNKVCYVARPSKRYITVKNPSP